MKERFFSSKLIILAIILFIFLFLFSTPSLTLIPGDFGSAGGGPPDGCVDFEDLMIFAIAYGSTPSDSNWNEVCDIAGPGGSLTPDGIIDFEDLMIFAIHYGEGSPPTKGSIVGTIMVPEASKSRNLSGWVPLPGATVTLTDSAGQTHTVITDENGNYSFSQVAPGSNYIITATGEVEGNTIVLKDIVPQLKAGEKYDAGTADAESTALALVVEDILDKDIEPDLNVIQQSTSYNTLVNEVLSVLEQNNNVTTDPEIKNTIYNSLDELIESWHGWFCGEEWNIKSYENTLVGPGPNYYSNSINNVWKDNQGNLHLRIIKREDKWYCAEVYTKREGLGYGKYEFDLGEVIMGKRNGDREISYENDLDENIVVGLFTYDGSLTAHKSRNEIDIEFARWGDANGDLGNFVVWYDATEGNENRNHYSFPIDLGDNSTHSFEWTANNIIYISSGIPGCPVYPESFEYIGPDEEGYGYIPIPHEEQVHMNLWLYDDTGNNVQGFPADLNVEEVEVVIKNFQFTARANYSPEITEFTINPPSPININQPTTLTCHATDEDGDILTYDWSAPDGGTITGSGEVVTWTAPDTPGTYKVACHVSDLYGGYCDVWDWIEVIDDTNGFKIQYQYNGIYYDIPYSPEFNEEITNYKLYLVSHNSVELKVISESGSVNFVTLNLGPNSINISGIYTLNAYLYNSISNAIEGNNELLDGEKVVVVPDTYYEWDINFPNKAITLQSILPESTSIQNATIINASNAGQVFKFWDLNNLGNITNLTGLTLCNGYYNNVGAGIHIYNSNPIIKYNVISYNNAWSCNGGGIRLSNGSNAIIENNVISHNRSVAMGGGIDISESSPIIRYNIISENIADSTLYGGAGIAVHSGSPVISDNEISNNSTNINIGSGIFIYEGTPIVENNTICGNDSNPQIYPNEFPNNDFYVDCP